MIEPPPPRRATASYYNTSWVHTHLLPSWLPWLSLLSLLLSFSPPSPPLPSLPHSLPSWLSLLSVCPCTAHLPSTSDPSPSLSSTLPTPPFRDDMPAKDADAIADAVQTATANDVRRLRRYWTLSRVIFYFPALLGTPNTRLVKSSTTSSSHFLGNACLSGAD